MSHLLQDKTLYLPLILGQIYTGAISAYPDQEQSDNGLYCLTFDLHSDMYMYALMKHADHFFRQLCQFRPDRCRLKDETFERLMMIRCNNEVLSPVVKDNKISGKIQS